MLSIKDFMKLERIAQVCWQLANWNLNKNIFYLILNMVWYYQNPKEIHILKYVISQKTHISEICDFFTTNLWFPQYLTPQ